jgi:cell wall-associated NlpC family hydrolase
MIRFSIFLLVMSALFFVGCSSSSTTTRDIEDKPTGVLQEENEFLFLAKINRENATEDDKKVTIGDLQKEQNTEELPDGVDRDRLLLEVVNYLGVRYSYGGNTKKGIDCSGYVCRVFDSALSKKLPRSTREQFKSGEKIGKNQLRFGDLVFFNTTGRSPSHVGIFLEDDIFAHASVVDGVTLSSLESTYYKKRFVGARRVLEN